MNCPYCNNSNLTETLINGENKCVDCDTVFKNGIVYHEGNYRSFMENTLTEVANQLEAREASIIHGLKREALGEKNNIDLIINALIRMTENFSNEIMLGKDKKLEVYAVIEGVEKIHTFAKVLCERNELDRRIMELVREMENQLVPDEVNPATTEGSPIDELLEPVDIGEDPAGTMPGMLPGQDEIDDSGESVLDVPADTGVLDVPETPYEEASQETKVGQDALSFESTCAGEPCKVTVENIMDSENRRYTVETANGKVVSWNEEKSCHDGLAEASEEDVALWEAGADGLKEELDALSSEVDGAEGTITPSVDGENPAMEATQLSAGMMNEEGIDAPDTSATDSELEEEIDPEHEEKEQKVIDKIQTSAEKAADRLDSVQAKLDALQDSIEKLQDLEAEEEDLGDDTGDVGGDEPPLEDEGLPPEGDEPPAEGETPPAEAPAEGDADVGAELDAALAEAFDANTKVGKGKHPMVAKPKMAEVTKVNGEKPDTKVSTYMKTVRNEDGKYTQEAASIPLTQEEADKLDEDDGELDEAGKKKLTKAKQDANEKNEPYNKANQMYPKYESFNGYRLGDRVKVQGYKNEFILESITTEPVRFNLTEGKVSITLDPFSGGFTLAEDADIRWEREANVINDTRKLWESVASQYEEKVEIRKVREDDNLDVINEACIGGVCSIGGSKVGGGKSMGISTTSIPSIITRIGRHDLPTVAQVNEIYAFVKNQQLNTLAKETAMSALRGRFANSLNEMEKVYDDAVTGSVQTDESYGYQGVLTRSFDVESQLNEGFEQLKKMGIV